MPAPLPFREVISAAGLPDGEVDERILRLGPDVVARTLLDEVTSRSVLVDGHVDRCVVQLELRFAGERLDHVVTIDEERSSVERGRDPAAAITVRQDLADLMREVFGPAGTGGVTREIHVTQYEQTPYSARVAAQVWHLVAAMSQSPRSLAELAVRFGSDKWGGRWYAEHYQRHVEPFRDRPVTLLEIGVGGYNAADAGGESLRMWKHWFRRGLVYGLDVFPKTGIEEGRLHVLVGDQGDPVALDAMARKLGPFDIVIDDGSHISHHVLTSFGALFPHVKPGGLYVIEDLATAYWPGWGGDPDPAAQYRTIALVKDLVDGLHHQETVPGSPSARGAATAAGPSVTDLTVAGLHVYPNLAIVEKGANSEQGSPDWLKQVDHSTAYPDASRQQPR